MNPLNYCSLAAAKRLMEAGIMLRTEVYFRVFDGETEAVTSWQKKSWQDQASRGHASNDVEFIPAPSMAELWRELPEGAYIAKDHEASVSFHGDRQFYNDFKNTNPCDALADLLIFVRNGEK